MHPAALTATAPPRRQTPQARANASFTTHSAAAVAYAALLDRIAACNPGGHVEEVLDQVGELLGGLSADGFVADLDAASDAIEADMASAANTECFGNEAGFPDVWPSRGGNDPDGGISAGLWDRICEAQNELARGWLRQATAIMAAPVRPAALFFRRAA